MLHLAAEALDVKFRAGFNLADTYVIVRALTQKVSRFLRLCLHHLGNTFFKIPINEQIKTTSSAVKEKVNLFLSHDCWLGSL